MKIIIITILTFGLFTFCNSTNKKSIQDETSEVILLENDNSSTKNNETTPENFDCDFYKLLNDSKTPKLAKDLFNNTAKNFGDNDPLEYFKNLKSKDKQEREFYFRALTNSYRIADGAYSEGLGYTGKEFIENNPKEFVSFFTTSNCFTNSDLEIWANILIVEFAIDNEGDYDKPFIDDFINKLKSNCKDCSKIQIETINKFGLTLNDKWNEYLKQIN